jgi:hypothetical protein
MGKQKNVTIPLFKSKLLCLIAFAVDILIFFINGFTVIEAFACVV